MRVALLFVSLVLMIMVPASAMNNYDDPRTLLSYMDRSLAPARDILRVATRVSADNHLVFQVKTRGERATPQLSDFVLLQIWQGKSHEILVPVDAALGDAVVVYVRDLDAKGDTQALVGSELEALGERDVFSAKRVPRGIEFSVPLNWIEFDQKIGYDAYTIRGNFVGQSFMIEEVYDQAGKGRGKKARRFSAITLLNNLCATRK